LPSHERRLRLRNRDLPLAARCRLAFPAGALEAWREAKGAEPPPDVLARILARYPGPFGGGHEAGAVEGATMSRRRGGSRCMRSRFVEPVLAAVVIDALRVFLVSGGPSVAGDIWVVLIGAP
jgi:hypothetical protein